MSKITIHDAFIRTIMADKNIARDYFQSYLPDFVTDRLDFSTLEQSPDSYISRELQKTMSDIVYVCCKKGSADAVKISLLIEHKSYIDKNTPIQIGSYIFSGLQKQIANQEKLTMIIPILLYHGRNKWKYQKLQSLFENLDEDWKIFLPDFDYVYNNLGEISDETVESLHNKFLAASILALKHSFDKIWLEDNALKILLALEGADGNLQSGLIVYLFKRSGLEEKGIREIIEALPTTLRDTVMSTADMFIEKGKKIGFEKGVEEGIEKGKTDFVTNMLQNTDFSFAKIAALANVSEEFVSNIRKQIDL